MTTILDLMSCFLFGGINLAGLRMQQYAKGLTIAVVVFLVAGTLVGLWPNPIFTRVTPISTYGIPLLVAQSLTVGLFFSLEREFYATNIAAVGSALALAGIACPLCNRLLDGALGQHTLSAHGELFCTVLGAAGVAVSGAVLVWRSAQLAFARVANDELCLR